MPVAVPKTESVDGDASLSKVGSSSAVAGSGVLAYYSLGPTELPTPGLGVVKQSSDGQWAVCSSKSVYIITPNLSTTLPPPVPSLSTLALNAQSDTPYRPSLADPAKGQSLLYYHTSVDLSSCKDWFYDWSKELTSWESISLGQAESTRGWKAISWSPSGISLDGGCILAILSDNYEVIIARPEMNRMNGVWSIVDALIPLLAKDTPDDLTPIAKIFRVQTVAMDWSGPVTSGFKKSLFNLKTEVDGSLFALSTRGGTIVILRHKARGKMEVLKTIVISEEFFVTKLAWAPWESAEKGTERANSEETQCRTKLAYTLTNGSVRYRNISLSITNSKVNLIVDEEETTVFSNKFSSIGNITTLSFANDFLIFTQPAQVYIVTFPTSSSSAHPVSNPAFSLQKIILQRQGSWPNASRLSPCCGVSFAAPSTLHVFLTDGTMHVIGNISGSGAAVVDTALSRELSTAIRDSSCEVEKLEERGGGPSDQISYSGADIKTSVIGWLHAPYNNFDLSYRSTYRTRPMFVVQPLSAAHYGNSASSADSLRALVASPPSLLDNSPSYLLSSHIYPLLSRFNKMKPYILADILELLNEDFPAPIDEMDLDNGPDMGVDWKIEFENGLRRGLWINKDLDGLRLKSEIGRVCQSLAKESVFDDFTVRLAAINQRLTVNFLILLVKWLKNIIPSLTSPADFIFVQRVVQACALLSSQAPEYQSALASSQNLSEALAEVAGEHVSPLGAVESPCPACQQPAPFDNLSSATCASGHTFAMDDAENMTLTGPPTEPKSDSDSNVTNVAADNALVLGPEALSSSRKSLLLIVFSIAQFLDIMQVSAMFLATVDVANDIGLALPQSEWIIITYSITFAATLLLAGRLADLFKPRHLFIGGFFAIGALSLAASFLSEKYGFLVLRALAGIAGAMTIPSAIHLIMEMYQGPAQEQALALFSLSGGVGNVLGFVLAGVLMISSWRWIFRFMAIVAIPLSIISYILLPKMASDFRPKEVGKWKRIDIPGAGLALAAEVCIILALTEGNENGWGSGGFIAPFILFFAFIGGFFYWEHKIPKASAMLPSSTWKIPNFAILAFLSLMGYANGALIQVQFSNYFQVVSEYSPIVTAAHLCCMGIAALLLGGIISGGFPKLLQRRREMIFVGVIISIGGFMLVIFSNGGHGKKYWSMVFPGFILASWGSILLYIAANIGLLTAGPPEMTGVAGALFNVCAQMGSSIMIAVQTAVNNAVDADISNWRANQAGYGVDIGVVVVFSIVFLIFYRPSKTHTPDEKVIDEPKPASV